VKLVKPGSTVHDVEALELFMYYQAKALQGHFGDDPALWTVRQLWNNFTGAWRREYGPIASDIIESVTNVRSNVGISKFLADSLLHCF